MQGLLNKEGRENNLIRKLLTSEYTLPEARNAKWYI
jgi:hypothetical protein